MSRIRVNAFSISLDGFGAGPDQSIDDPLGRGAEALHHWMFETSLFSENGTAGVDDGFARRSMAGLGAWILGRNMFGPIRGPWPDEEWKGWWGDDPPYHVPVFVLSHHPRPPVEMEGGTIFQFVTDGIESALDSALKAANGLDVRIGGGAETIRQYLRAGLIDELHVAVAPVLLGSGEPLFAGLDLPELGYGISERAAGEGAMHYVMTRERRESR